MNKIFFLFSLLFLTVSISSQEICNNGIDDDLNGLIDLNDTTACSCNTLSVIPNPSFEETVCCPTTFGQMSCAQNWAQPTNATADYFNCGFNLVAYDNAGLGSPPDGSGYSGAIISDVTKEYFGGCLLNPLIANESYTLQMDIVAFPIISGGTSCNGGTIYFSDINYTIWGNPGSVCSSFPLATKDCPSVIDASWVPIGSVNYSPTDNWSSLTITFSPPTNISTIMIGAPCNIPPSYVQGFVGSCVPYFAVDNLILEQTTLLDTVFQMGDWCNNNIELSVTSTTGATYQWFLDGVAIIGEINNLLEVSVNNYGSGTYTLVTTTASGCVSDSIDVEVFSIPTVNTPANTDYCHGITVPTSSFSSSPPGATFSWTNSNTSIGLAASGSGNVPSFTATNTGASSISGTITVTPTLNSCAGTPSNYTITVHPTPTVSLPANASYCPGDAVPASAFSSTPAGGTFTWTNSNTAIGLAASGSGNVPAFTATNAGATAVSGTISVIPTVNSCPGNSTDYSITVDPEDDPSFSYPSATYCITGADPIATILGTLGGDFTISGAGVINSSDGTIDLDATGLGPFAIVYSTIPAGNSCPSNTAFNINITAAPSGGFSYDGPNYCQNATAPNLTFDPGASGGTFSATPTGLSINSSSGAIDLANSDPGIYKVYNTIAPAGGCAAALDSTSIEIFMVDSALFSYSATTYCITGTDPVAVLGTNATTGGNFSISSTGSINPSDGTIDLSASGLGTYTVTYNTAPAGNPCTSSSTFNVTITAAPSGGFSYDSPNYCQNATAPSLTFDPGASGGTFSATPAGLSINSSSGDIDLVNSDPGLYKIYNTIAPAGGCAAALDSTSIEIFMVDSALFSYSATTYCITGTDPIAILGANATTGGNFSISGAGTINSADGTIDLSSSGLGSYTITYNTTPTGNPCPSSSTFNINITAAPSGAFSYDSPNYCQNATAPSLTFDPGASGGNFSAIPAGLSINSSSGDIDLANSDPGIYKVYNTIAPAGGCAATIDSTSIEIFMVDSALFSYSTVSFCITGTDPMAILGANATTGGNFSISGTGSINPTDGTIDLSASGLGSYTVTYNSTPAGNPCPSSSTFNITITAAPSGAFSYDSPNYCQNAATPTLTFDTGASGGNFSATPAGLSINPSTGAIDLTNSIPISPSAYTIYNIIAPAGGCAATIDSTSIEIFMVDSALFSYSAASFCITGTDPVAVLGTNATTGGNFSISGTGSINPADGTIDLSASGLGSYTITYNTAPTGNPCPSSSTFTITITNGSPTVDTLPDITICDDYILPFLTVGDYYSSSGGISPIAAGTNITITDTLFIYTETGTIPNCFDEDTFVVTINNTPIVNSTPDIVTCDSYTLPNITAGNYYSSSGGIGLINAGASITSNQTIYNYAESGTTPNCFSEDTFVVTINTTPIVNTLTDLEACDIYTLPIISSGNYFQSSGGINSILEGTNITITDTLYIYAETGTTPNCFDEDTFIVTINTTPVVDIIDDTALCDGYFLPSLTIGDYYLNSGGIDSIPSGTNITDTETLYTYAETGTVPNCFNEDTFEVIIIATPLVGSSVDIETCDNYNLPPLLVGDYYTSSGGVGPIAAGTNITTTQTIYTYAESGTVPNCFTEDTFVVTVNTTPVVDVLDDTTLCDGYLLPALTVGDYYSASGGVGPIPSGSNINSTQTIYIYAETGTVPNCFTEDTFVVTIHVTPTATINSFTDVTCNGATNGTATADGSDPMATYTYLWDTSTGSQITATATALPPGTFSVVVTDALSGCFDDTTVTISQPSPVTVTATLATICVGQTASLSATGAGGNSAFYTYNWDNGNFVGSPYNVSPVMTTNYSVTASDANGCPSSPVVTTVTVRPPLQITAGNETKVCIGESAVVSGVVAPGAGNGGPYTYSWDNGLPSGPSHTVTPQVTTTYTITVNDGCSDPAQDQMTVIVNPLPTVSFTADTLDACEDPVTSITFYTIPGVNDSLLTWDLGDGSILSGDASGFDTITYTYPSAGSYDVSLTILTDSSSGGCVDSLTQSNYIEVHVNPIAAFTMDPNPTTMLDLEVNFYDESTVFATPNTLIYEWNFGGLDTSSQPNPSYTFPEDTGSYLVTLDITDENGCENNTSNMVIVKGQYAIYLPSAFTPDGDGLNDEFIPLGFGIAERGYDFFIFNRWGELIFESHHPEDGWNGEYNGRIVKEEVYVWKLSFTDILGEVHQKVGKITLLR